MKFQTSIICVTVFAAAISAAAAGPAHVEAETNAPVRSIFILPTNPTEGRDPFFPNSMRPYEAFISKRQVELSSIEVKGFSEINGHRYVIINNHTFGEGDEADVLTPEGRVHVHCLAITPDSVLVEAGGVRHLLKFQDR